MWRMILDLARAAHNGLREALAVLSAFTPLRGMSELLTVPHTGVSVSQIHPLVPRVGYWNVRSSHLHFCCGISVQRIP